LLERGHTGMALLYAGVSVVGCLAATWAGMRL
jgi:fluoride ion exporter CrcB/FEX